MERDAQMADLPVLLPLFRVVKEVRRLDNAALAVIAVIVDGLDVVEQIVVDVVHAQILQLALECLLDLLFRDQQKGRELGGYRIAVSGMPLHQGLPGGLLALPVVIDKAGVEVGISCLQESVHHPIQLRIVKVGRVTANHGQSHHSKSKVFHILSPS